MEAIMTRPLKEGLDYFPHDVDASTDEKIEVLTSLYGNDGYAFYFIMLERIYRNTGCFIDISNEEKKQEIFLILSKKMRLSLKTFKKILETALEYNLFDRALYQQGKISSEAIQKRAAIVFKKRKDMQLRYMSKTGKTLVSDAENTSEWTVSGENILSDSTQSKEKKSKEKHLSEEFSPEAPQHKSDSDDKDHDDLCKRMIALGVNQKQADKIICTYDYDFIQRKLSQIIEKNKCSPVQNMPAYIIKVFQNASAESLYELQKKQKAEELQQKKEKEIAAKKQKEVEEAESARIFQKITDELIEKADVNIRADFYNQIIKNSSVYKKFFDKEGYNNLIINAIFRKYLYDKYCQNQKSTNHSP